MFEDRFVTILRSRAGNQQHRRDRRVGTGQCQGTRQMDAALRILVGDFDFLVGVRLARRLRAAGFLDLCHTFQGDGQRPLALFEMALNLLAALVSRSVDDDREPFQFQRKARCP